MIVDVKFQENGCTFDADFGEVQTASDGGFERGYESGSEVGYKDGENSAYTIDDIALRNIERDIVITAGEVVDNAFYKVPLIASVTSNTVKSLGNSSFIECTSLKKAIIPNCTKIGNYSFSGCTSLAQIDVDSLLTIGTGAFQHDIALKSIVLPKATDINANGFVNCTILDTVILRTNTICKLVNSSAFNGTPIINGTGYIYVPRALLSDDDETKDYRRATNWSRYAAQFRAIEDYPDICGG